MKKILALSLALIMLLGLCGCGASSDKYAAQEPMAAPAEAMPYEASMDMAMEESGLGFYSERSGSTANGDSGSDVPDENPQKIIYSADATVETTEFEKSVEALNRLVDSYKGWIESSSINNANYYNISRGRSYNRSASYTIRIPGEKFFAMMNGLSTLGNVPYTHTYSENVSSQYYDVQARLTACKTQETRMLEMLEVAETVEDVLTIEEKLTDLRYRIDSLQSSLNNWDRRVSYSTLHLSIDEVEEYTPEQETKISYGRELWLTFVDAIKGAGRFLKGLLLFIVSALPTLAILAVIFFVFRPLLKKLVAKMKEKSKARKEAKAAKKAAKAAEKAERAKD